MTVIKNINTEALATTPTNFVGIIVARNYNVVVAIGNDEKEVHDEAYFDWAVKWNYEGFIKVLPATEIIVEN